MPTMNVLTGKFEYKDTAGELHRRIKSKCQENQGRVSYSFGIYPILDEAKTELFDALGSENIDDIAATIKKWFGELRP